MAKFPQLDSEIPIVPKSAPAVLRPVFDGAHDEECSVKYFSDFLPDSWGCEEVTPGEKLAYHLRIFRFLEEAPSRSRTPLNSIQQKIKEFLFSLQNFKPNYWGMTALMQFWVPITVRDGRKILSVSKQPFAIRQSLKGLCRYRYYCLELCRIGNRIEVGDELGPVGRAFNRGSIEFSPHVDIYSKEDFPFKDHAKHCGVAGYLALPVFELGNGDIDGHQRSCVGVLEFISLTKNILSSFDIKICMMKLKEVGLAIRYPSHPKALTEVRPYFNFPLPGDTCKGTPDEISSVLDSVRKAYNLPLIQVWIPCICNGSEVSTKHEPNISSFSRITHLVCGLKCLDRDERWSVWLSLYACCDSQVYFVEDGESWVGRAHSLKKICFVKDIRQYNIVEYPLLTLGHSSDLLACFAVPLQLVNPMLPPLVLEVFLPTRYKFDPDRGAILKPLLSMVARELSKYNASYGYRQYEECLIDISHSDVDYGCVYDRTPAIANPLLSYHSRKGKSVCPRLRMVEECYVQHQHYQPNDATEIKELQVPAAENKRPCTVPSHKSLAFGQSTVKRRQRSSGNRRKPARQIYVHPAQQTPELPTEFVDLSDEDKQPEIRYCPSTNFKEKQEEAAMISSTVLFEVPITTSERVASFGPVNNEVVYGVSTPFTYGKGKNSEPEYDKVDHGTSIPSTHGKDKNTEPEYDEVDHGTSIPSSYGKGKNTEPEHDEVDHGTSVPTNTNGRSTVPENDEADHSYSMIVKARYKDDVVRFPFSSSSGMEGLRRDLLKRLELEVGRFKIKYLEGGDWIMLACSEDLIFHMRALASSGQTTFDLSVFPTT